MHLLHLYCNALQGTSKCKQICRQARSHFVCASWYRCLCPRHKRQHFCQYNRVGIALAAPPCSSKHGTAQEPLDAAGLTEAGSYQLVHKAGTGEHEGHEHFLVPQGLHCLLGLIWPNSPAIQHLQPWQVSYNVCPASHCIHALLTYMHHMYRAKSSFQCAYSALMSLSGLTKPDCQCQQSANAFAGDLAMQALRLGDL